MKKPEVGDRMIHIRTTHGRGMGNRTPVVVTKVGRKYFHVAPADGSSCWWLEADQFHLDTGYQKVNGGRADRVASEETLADEDYRASVMHRFRAARIDFLRDRDYTTEQLEAAADALGLPREESE